MQNVDTPLILTLDIGTSATRAALYDTAARLVPDRSMHVPNQLITSADGGSEFDPYQLLQNVVTAIDGLLALAGDDARRITAVAWDTFVVSLMGVDAQGVPQTPLYTYADVRSADDAERLRRDLGSGGRGSAHNRTGCLVHTAYWPARFHWFARTRSDIMTRVAYWMTLGEYLMWTFTGHRVVSFSVASWTGMLNRQHLTWDAEWLAELPVREAQLSTLVDMDRPAVGLQGDWARRWPALDAVPWYAAIGDGAAANIGSGCYTPDRIALTVGTTGAMRVVVDPNAAAVPPGLWLYRVDRVRGLLGGATTEGGNLFAWLRENLRLPPTDVLEQMLSTRPPAGHGVTVLPFIGGERAPGWREYARAAYNGISLHSSAVDLVQAGLEGIGYRFAIIYERLLPFLPAAESRRIVASGGALLSSPAWLQMMADILGEPVTALAERELTGRGTTLLALEALGIIRHLDELPAATGKVYLPDPEHHAVHARARLRQLDLYQRLYGDGE